jgi:hypothetical protein
MVAVFISLFVCKMQGSEYSCAKWARLLSLNQLREIVMDCNTDEV